MDINLRIKSVLRDALNIGARAELLGEQSALLGALPEFDSMAVVSVITMLEEEFGFTIDDDELHAEVFQTVGTLSAFVQRKLADA
jgi:acyl carrier protein